MSTPALLVRTALPRSRIKPGTRPCPGLLRLRQTVLPISIGITSGLVALTHQRPMRLDAAVQQQTRTLATNPPKNKEDGRFLSAETVKQLSRGSLAGFFTGLMVSVFSKTLVLLAGITMLIFHVAARNGIDLVAYFKLKEHFRGSRILAALNQHTAFKLSFALAFVLSAFMSF
ncbi:uncharacterized protein CTHT_0022470 [Thermochaetoides thermophila DSM 1495]|uniref:FUN14 family protein n=1 Tax=Chaetomium thermophilum (strain DSM 1495 / CBS 144.50 / IMI 039719) TaxID=759272 RepID=G0S4D9_CHATD|nr:hypothetical protein CTHT_0022470 [Thermochaetoides thermophila DSM 1495]EGS20417.1 hypothetical protein CTHT_0022470 [Thermochaetoides thermophila DSM 1495]